MLTELMLIGLVLRDLHDGWFGLGFAKSRGLGTVEIKLNQAVVQYPGCILSEDKKEICAFGTNKKWRNTHLLGVGEFLTQDDAKLYNFPSQDSQDSQDSLVAAQEMELGFGVQLTWKEGTVNDLFERSVKSWSQLLGVAK